ncbi:MAG TPA: HEAT repeat domain-containing protein [Kofleriaceae bacterium]|nr:HEAT repeat domain-containing protein [Kofleriaceae bacterium]
MARSTKRSAAAGAASLAQARIAALKALDPGQPAAVAELRDALRSTTGYLIAAVAGVIAEHRLDALVGELAPAFARLCDDAARRDPGCRGKLAIAKALHELDHWDDAVFVAGLRIEQKEGWGGAGGAGDVRDDTAAELRGVCGLAHAHFGRPDALDVLADLLLDPERVTRVAAAQGLGDAGRPDATALLRYKLRVGDAEAEVLAACLESMLSLARDSSYDFALTLLRGHDERAEVAALALGGGRFAEAFEALSRWCIGAAGEQRHRVGYLAIALLRSDAGNTYLLDAIRTHGKLDAIAAGRALATFKDDAGLAEQIRAAANEQKDRTARDQILALL